VNLDLFDTLEEPEEAEQPSPPVSSEAEQGEELDSPGPGLGTGSPDGSDPEEFPLEPGPDGSPSTPPSEPTIWTVSQINQAVRTLLEESLPPLWVSGEVANWKRAGSGHCYFTLKDESAQLRCVMWRGDAARLPMDPEEGMRVRLFGQLTLYENRGEFQCVARVLEGEEGEGLWRLAFEKLRARLESEGLLALERKRPLPRFPQTIGIVTSLTGAALHDILTVLRRRAPWLRVLVAGARVQGEGAALEIARAVGRLGGSGRVDVLIVGRGGGSIEDLWAFNEEPVARAVAECPVPVVSAVGHEVDVTISDLVADLRAPTPSAAAEAVAPDKEEILRYLGGASERLARGLRRGVEVQRRAVIQVKSGLRRAGGRITEPGRRALDRNRLNFARLGRGLLEPKRRMLAAGREGLNRSIEVRLRSRRETLIRLSGRIDALSPLATLRRGYAVPLDSTGRVLRGVQDFPAGQEFELRVVDGRVRCESLETKEEGVTGES
jgi:exodeoxyribonuclease VII large subunit